jgi:peptidylprolyl isomerase
MAVKLNDWVSVKYEGSFSDGKVFDKNDEKNPLFFQVGARQVIKGFEDALIGMKLGQEKKVTMKSKDAYGEKNKTINDIPKEAFAGQDLKTIPLNTELQIMSNMGPMVIVVKEVTKDKIKAIINHPMAGKDLTFKIKLLKVLDKKEVAKLMEDMQQHSCGCGCEHDSKDSKHSHKEESCCEDDCCCDSKESKTKSKAKPKPKPKAKVVAKKVIVKKKGKK